MKCTKAYNTSHGTSHILLYVGNYYDSVRLFHFSAEKLRALCFDLWRIGIKLEREKSIHITIKTNVDETKKKIIFERNEQEKNNADAH